MGSAGCREDFSLIREVQGGNHAAFDQLVYAHDQSVLRLALRITRSEVDAQDVYQETFLRAFKKLGSFRYECAFSTWIHRIATNVCLDHLRRKLARREARPATKDADGEECDLLDQAADNSPLSNPERQVLRRELGAHISSALARLTPRQRIIFELKHYQGFTVQAVSEILDCSEASIKVSLFRTTRKLRIHLGRFYRKNGSSSRHAVSAAL